MYHEMLHDEFQEVICDQKDKKFHYLKSKCQMVCVTGSTRHQKQKNMVLPKMNINPLTNHKTTRLTPRVCKRQSAESL